MASPKRIGQLGVGLAISAAFLWFAFRDVAFADVWASIQTADSFGLLAVVASGLLAILSRAQRWVPLFRAGSGVTVPHAFVAQSIGFAGNTVLPFRAGEALKAYALAQRARQPFTTVLATVVLERIFDLLGVGVTLAVALALVPIPESAGPQVAGAARLLGFVAAASAVGVLAFIFLRRTMLGIVDAITSRLPAVVGQPIHAAAHAFVDGLNTLGNPVQLIRAVGLTLWVWFTLALPFALMAWAMDLPGQFGAPAWQFGVACSALVAAFVMIPAAPGFVGTYQAGCIVALAIFGVPRDIALGFSLLAHVLTMGPVAVLGLALAFRQGVLGARPAGPVGEGTTAAPGDSDA